jgi:MFS family permease
MARSDGSPAVEVRSSTLWRDPDFRRLWIAGTASQLGSEVSALAIPLTAAITLGAGPLAMGIVAAAAAAPALLFGLIAGVWVDRVARRRVLIACDAARAAILIAIPAAWLLGLLSLPYLVCAAFLASTCTVFFDIAHSSYLPSLVRGEALVEANTNVEIGESLTQFAGPGLAGVLVQFLTAPIAIAADAISYVVSAFVLGSIRTREAIRPRPRGGRTLIEAREGLAVVLRHPLLRPSAAYAAATQLCMSAVLAVYVLYALDELGLSPAVLGFVGMAAAPGTILGALLVGRTVRRAGVGAAMLAASVLPGLGVLIMALAALAPDTGTALLAAGWFLLGLGSIYDINEVSLRQSVTPDVQRGRVNATRFVAFYGVMPIGALLGGIIGALTGTSSVFVLGAAGLLSASLLIALSRVRRLRELPGADLKHPAGSARPSV